MPILKCIKAKASQWSNSIPLCFWNGHREQDKNLFIYYLGPERVEFQILFTTIPSDFL